MMETAFITLVIIGIVYYVVEMLIVYNRWDE